VLYKLLSRRNTSTKSAISMSLCLALSLAIVHMFSKAIIYCRSNPPCHVVLEVLPVIAAHVCLKGSIDVVVAVTKTSKQCVAVTHSLIM
jgi:hypothetical protein